MSSIKELEEKVKELMKEIETLKRQKAEEFEYPFEAKEEYWSVGIKGGVSNFIWSYHEFDTKKYEQGHVFKTKEEAERERDKRILLMKFRQFRDKHNKDWIPDFSQRLSDKYSIQFDYETSDFGIYNSGAFEGFRLFGYFKNEEDCKRAIELFGDEIIRLWVEE